MVSRLRAIQVGFQDQVARELRQEAELIMKLSKAQYVPVDLGTLKNSGHVQEVERKGLTLQVAMVYGGPASPYALAVHEAVAGSTSSALPPSWRGTAVNFQRGGPKYLHLPMMRELPKVASRIAARIQLGSV